jgi:hypothetical protein
MSAKKSGRRAIGRDREGNGKREIGSAVVFMVSSLNASKVSVREVNCLGRGVRRSPSPPFEASTPRNAQFHDLGWRDQLHTGRAHRSYGFWTLHLGLHAAAMTPSRPRNHVMGRRIG